MNETSDAELLAAFARDGSEDAFAALVRRHVSLVHSVALRHTANPLHAEEITQAVFIILARKAGGLGSKIILSGWLYHTARLTAANFQRGEIRRVRREQEAFMQSSREPDPAPAASWPELAASLDEAMAGLGQTDRDAIVLRYFENKSLAEVGIALGVEERAAQKRISRAVEKLRKCLGRRGVSLAAGVLTTALSAHSIQAAPAGLATTIAATGLAGSAVAGTTLTLVKGTIQLMNWTKTKIASVAAGTFVLGVACGHLHNHIYQAIHRHHAADAEAYDQKLQDERAASAANAAGTEQLPKTLKIR